MLWRADASDLRPTLTLDLGAPTWIEAVEIGEEIAEGQRIERVVVTGRRGGETIDLGETGCVGNRRIL
ncbi:hypothetical protein ABI077_15220, partial [Enterococcus faecium]